MLLLRPPLTSFPESTSTKYPGAKSRITYIPATLTANYSIKGGIPPPLSSLLGLDIQQIDIYCNISSTSTDYNMDFLKIFFPLNKPRLKIKYTFVDFKQHKTGLVCNCKWITRKEKEEDFCLAKNLQKTFHLILLKHSV